MTKGIVLSVAGSDCSGGAGIQADIKTIAALGGYAAAAITAVTVQNTLGVQSVFPIPAEVVGQQMLAVLEDLEPDAVKIGMTGSAEVVREIAHVLRQHPVRHVVFDPVMVSTSGHRLLTDEAVEAIRTDLLPVVSLVTPNLDEVAPLMSTDKSFITYNDMQQAARQIHNRYGCACLVKGGHLRGGEMRDILYDGRELHEYSVERIATRNLHGTGCTLSSAIATYLSQGMSLQEAVKQAKEYITGAIEAGASMRIGKGNGPLWHYKP